MAESADIRLALADLIGTAVYPNGTSSASTIAGMTGKAAIYQSDIKPGDIDQRVPAGDVLIGVMEYGDGRSTKRFPPVDLVTTTPATTLSWTVSPGDSNTAPSATLGGTISTSQNIGLIVDGAAFVYAIQSGDTLDSAAAALAAKIELVRSASVSDATISIPGSHSITGRVGVVADTLREVGRQMSRYLVSVWAAKDAIRQAAVTVVRAVLDDARRIVLPDNSVAWIGNAYEVPVYEPKKLGISRTNICYAVEYGSYLAGTAAQAIAIGGTVQGGTPPISGFTATQPPSITIEV